MKVIVLGAGVIGVTSAWFLNRARHEVTVIERCAGPALETSHANGGQISISHAVPWANPGAPYQILKWLGRADAPLRFRPRLDLSQWLWGTRFLLECLPSHTRDNARRILALGRISLETLKALRAELNLAYDQQTRGILSIYTDQHEFDEALSQLPLLHEEGVRREAKTPAECAVVEPALSAAQPRLAGGIYAPDDESGDAFQFTSELAEHCVRRGVEFQFGQTVQRMMSEGGRITGVHVMAGGELQLLEADAYVVALGSWSKAVLRGLDISLPIYPVKGYSVTLPLSEQHQAPVVSLTDEARKLVFSRLGNRLRVAGTAELTGYDASINAARCNAILDRVFDLFPQAGNRNEAQLWAGLRPATPGNVPLVGKTRYPNLFLNTGHGTLGWTLACGSAHVLAEVISGKNPAIDLGLQAA